MTKEKKTSETYYQKNKEERLDYACRYYELHEEELKEKHKNYSKVYAKIHSDRRRASQRKWRDSHRALFRALARKYCHSEKGKKTTERYRKSEKGMINMRKSVSKRKGLGYIELLPPVWGCVMHHVDDEFVIPIPEVVHQIFGGLSREMHREAVDNWMREIRPDLWLLTHLP